MPVRGSAPAPQIPFHYPNAQTPPPCAEVRYRDPWHRRRGVRVPISLNLCEEVGEWCVPTVLMCENGFTQQPISTPMGTALHLLSQQSPPFAVGVEMAIAAYAPLFGNCAATSRGTSRKSCLSSWQFHVHEGCGIEGIWGPAHPRWQNSELAEHDRTLYRDGMSGRGGGRQMAGMLRTRNPGVLLGELAVDNCYTLVIHK